MLCHKSGIDLSFGALSVSKHNEEQCGPQKKGHILVFLSSVLKAPIILGSF
jgi:hypothetical protein